MEGVSKMTAKDYIAVADALQTAMEKTNMPITRGSNFLGYFTAGIRNVYPNFNTGKFYEYICPEEK